MLTRLKEVVEGGVGPLAAAAFWRAAAQAAALAVVAGRLGAADFGTVTAVTVVGNIGTQLTASGAYARTFTGTTLRGDLPSSGDFLVAALGTATMTMGGVLLVGLPMKLVLVSALLGALMAYGACWAHASQGQLLRKDRHRTAAIVVTFRPSATLLAAAVFALLGPATVFAWLITLVAVFAIDLVAVGLLRRLTGLTTLRRRPAWATFLPMLAIGFGTVGTALLRTADQLLLAFLSPSEQLGNYAVAAKAIDVAVLLLAAMLQARHRQLQSAVEQGAQTLHRVLRGIGRRAMLSAALLAVVIALASHLVPVLLGESYGGVPRLTVVLAAATPARAVFLLAGFTLLLQDRAGVRNTGVWLALGGNLALNVALIPAFGAIGAAVATLLVEWVLAVWLWRVTVRYEQLPLAR